MENNGRAVPITRHENIDSRSEAERKLQRIADEGLTPEERTKARELRERLYADIGGPARPTIIPDQTVVRARPYPYSSVVGTGMLLYNKGGAVVGQLSLINVSGGKDEAVAMIAQAAHLMELGLGRREELLGEVDRESRTQEPRSHEYLASAHAAAEAFREAQPTVDARLAGLLAVAAFLLGIGFAAVR